MTVLIRAARPDDAEALATLSAEVQALHIPHKPQFFRPVAPAALAEWFCARFAEPDTHIWIAEVGAVPVGYAVIVARTRLETPLTVATLTHEIDSLGVRADARKRGVARSLVQHVLAQARRAGISEVTLTSWSFNTDAHQVFRRLGFRPEVLKFVIDC